jgi:hypothetical protein
VELVQVEGQRQQDDGALRPRRGSEEHRSCRPEHQTDWQLQSLAPCKAVQHSSTEVFRTRAGHSRSMRQYGRSRTCERLKDEEREYHLAEDALEQPAARLVAPLKKVQHCGRRSISSLVSSLGAGAV